MTKLILLAIALLTSHVALAALPAASVLPKDGDCPSAYVAKDNQCEPTAHA